MLTSVNLRGQCESSAICNVVLLQLSHAVMKREAMAMLPDPLEDLSAWCQGRTQWRNLCAPCAQVILAEIVRLRQATWNNLGTIFRVPEWQPGSAVQPINVRFLAEFPCDVHCD